MSSAPVKPSQSEDSQRLLIPEEAVKAQGVVAWSSLIFALLQSVCTFFTALDGVRLLIGVGSLASVVGVGESWDKFHTDWIRVPMVIFALVGSSLNLTVLMHVRHLRSRRASQWRQQPLTQSKIRKERLQMTLSLVTLALLVLEEVTHLRTFHHF
jgi:hypothetical protein